MTEIVQNGDPILRAISDPVQESEFGGDALGKIISDMAEALDAQKDGVAIAAPQIAVSKRIFLVRYDRIAEPITHNADMQLPADIGIYINPTFTKASRRREEMDEGCLSVRGLYGKTYRHQRATVTARDTDGKKFERGAGGILAQVFQHEIDHLDGMLFIDHAVELYRINRDTNENEPLEEVPIEA